MSFSVHKVRYAMIGLLVAAGFALAPAAMARSHVNIGLNFGFPGVSVGYSNWGGGYGFAGNYAYSGYYPSYAPAYYGPSYYGPRYYSSYYSPVYYGPSYYGPTYYSRPPVHRVKYTSSYPSRPYYREPSRSHRSSASYYSDRGNSSHRGDYGNRASYYDRGGRR